MSALQATIDRLRSEIARLRKDDAALAHKEAALAAKSGKAGLSAAKASSLSTLAAKLREQERAAKDLASIHGKRADLAKRIAEKEKTLAGSLSKRSTEEERLQKKLQAERERVLRDQAARVQTLSSSLATIAASASSPEVIGPFDFFISHASEDKAEFVRALAAELMQLGARVFYDEATLKVGDSLRRSIDHGLRQSRFGVVVLSSAFFEKEWPARELDGLTALEVDGRSRILPIWHKVSKDEVRNYSPTLADKVALNTSLNTTEEIAAILFDRL